MITGTCNGFTAAPGSIGALLQAEREHKVHSLLIKCLDALGWSAMIISIICHSAVRLLYMGSKLCGKALWVLVHSEFKSALSLFVFIVFYNCSCGQLEMKKVLKGLFKKLKWIPGDLKRAYTVKWCLASWKPNIIVLTTSFLKNWFT